MQCTIDGNLSKKALVKFYTQMPRLNREFQELEIGANQATSFDSREFIALETLSENFEVSKLIPHQQKKYPLVPVPGGF